MSEPRKYRLKVVSDVSGFAPAVAKHGLVNCAISARAYSEPSPSDLAKRDKFLDYIYSEAPVVGFRVLKNDVVVVREARNPEELAERLVGAEKRGDIEYLSKKSRRRLSLVAGNTETVFRSFVTVSYPSDFPCDGKVVKNHLRALLMALRRRCEGLTYLWFLEFQRRGAPHVHIFLSHDLPEPRAEMTRKAGRINKTCLTNWESHDWLADRWFEIVGSGDERHRRAGTAWEVVENPDGAARYVAKESYKTFQKVVPKGFQNVGRFWGASRGIQPVESGLIRATPEQMAKIFPPEAFDSEGNPYPVIFSGAECYTKIRDTAQDPERIREWQGCENHRKTATLRKFTLGSKTFKPGPLHAID